MAGGGGGMLIVDSIAVRCLSENALLVGVGNELHLYKNGNKRQIEVIETRLRGKVHGIVRNGSGILVHGEKEFLVFHYEEQCEAMQLVCRGALSDWISSAIILADETFVLLTAHSVAVRCDIATGAIKEKASCADKSTLYCSHMQGNRWEDLRIFGGNAFGELLIWRALCGRNIKHKNKNAKAKATSSHALQRVQMHNGVIFSIDYNEQLQLLTTTSDDRSIKFWKATAATDNVIAIDATPAIDMASSTTTPSVTAVATAACCDINLSLMATGFGHVARVFRNKIIEDEATSYAITVSEDSHFCLWRCNGELLFKRREHFGATIWNLDYDDRTKTLYTVGATGNVRAFNLSDILQQRASGQWPKIVPALTSAVYIAKIKFLNNEMLIGVTNENCLMCKPFDSGDTWQPIFPVTTNDVATYKCTVLEVYGNLIAYCGYRHLTLIEYDAAANAFHVVYDATLLNDVIRAFHFLKSHSFLISDKSGDACVLVVENYQHQHQEQRQHQISIELPKCKEPWITTALLINDEFLLVSNRQGNCMLYKHNNCKYELAMTLKRLHGSIGATVFKLFELSADRALVQSAGHDGTVKILAIERATAKLQMHSRQNIPISWVEDICGDNTDQQLLLGFNENHFVVWSKLHDFLCHVNCGGGHRCWHYKLHRDTTTNVQWFLVVFIKNKQVHQHRIKLFNDVGSNIRLPPPNQWHTRACNVAAIVDDDVTDGDDVPSLLVSAGDDNLIKVFSYLPSEESSFQQRAEIHSHISNVRALRVLALPHHADSAKHCLIFSGGGRAQLCINKLNLGHFHVQQLLTYTLQPTEYSTNGTITSVSSHLYNINPETRIMSIDVQQPVTDAGGGDNDDCYCIYLGCSDGYVRQMHWRVHQDPVIKKELFYGQCVLQVRVLSTSGIVLIAGTDGCIRLYDMDLLNVQLVLKHHLSGVNALDVRHIQNQCHILSGGDDQTVAYSLLNLEKGVVLRSLQLPWLHTAQVTAVRLGRSPDNHQNHHRLIAYTSSVDQQLCCIDLETAELLEEYHSCVADIKGLCLDKANRCFLYGCGFQIHHFAKTK